MIWRIFIKSGPDSKGKFWWRDAGFDDFSDRNEAIKVRKDWESYWRREKYSVRKVRNA